MELVGPRGERRRGAAADQCDIGEISLLDNGSCQQMLSGDDDRSVGQHLHHARCDSSDLIVNLEGPLHGNVRSVLL